MANNNDILILEILSSFDLLPYGHVPESLRSCILVHEYDDCRAVLTRIFLCKKSLTYDERMFVTKYACKHNCEAYLNEKDQVYNSYALYVLAKYSSFALLKKVINEHPDLTRYIHVHRMARCLLVSNNHMKFWFLFSCHKFQDELNKYKDPPKGLEHVYNLSCMINSGCSTELIFLARQQGLFLNSRFLEAACFENREDLVLFALKEKCEITQIAITMAEIHENHLVLSMLKKGSIVLFPYK